MIIEVNNLSKHFGQKKAVDNVSFNVEKGEVIGFLGPNGAGKTTTMRMLTGYLHPTSGTASINGKDIIYDSLECRMSIGYLPESTPLYRELTVWQYLNYISRIKETDDKNAIKNIERIIDVVGIREYRNTFINHLSKGYRQRVGIGQALIGNPKVIILDEPTEGLDPNQKTEVLSLIRNLGSEHVILLSTHILSEVSQTCSRILIIHRGKLIASDSQEDLESRMGTDKRLDIIVDAPKDVVSLEIKKLDGIENIIPTGQTDTGQAFTITVENVKKSAPEIARLITAKNWPLHQLHQSKITLEEIFARLTKESEF